MMIGENEINILSLLSDKESVEDIKYCMRNFETFLELGEIDDLQGSMALIFLHAKILIKNNMERDDFIELSKIAYDMVEKQKEIYDTIEKYISRRSVN